MTLHSMSRLSEDFVEIMIGLNEDNTNFVLFLETSQQIKVHECMRLKYSIHDKIYFIDMNSGYNQIKKLCFDFVSFLSSIFPVNCV